MTLLDDLDDDGEREIALGFRAAVAPGKPTKERAGAVLVLSGKSGKEIRRHVGERPGDAFGAAVVAMSDVNSDRVGDYCVGVPNAVLTASASGDVRCIDGARGAELWRFAAPEGVSGVGATLCSVDDINGDGMNDIVVGAPGDYRGGGGVLFALSGKTGETLWRVREAREGVCFGTRVASVYDLDGDGRREVLARATPAQLPSDSPCRSAFVVLSAKDGTTLGEWEYTTAGPGIWNDFRGPMDVNGKSAIAFLAAGSTVETMRCVLVDCATGEVLGRFPK